MIGLLVKNVVFAGFVTLALGDQHSLILKEDCSVWSTGYNKFGQLGDGSTTEGVNFVLVVSIVANAIAAGSHHSIVIKKDGSVWTSGWNYFDQLGDGSKTDRNFFQVVLSG